MGPLGCWDKIGERKERETVREHEPSSTDASAKVGIPEAAAVSCCQGQQVRVH